MYDIEQFLKDAGAERVSEKAVLSLEMELQDTVNEMVEEAALYANYAGRKRVINLSDIDMLKTTTSRKRHIRYKERKARADKNNAYGIRRSSAMKEIIDPSSIKLVAAQGL